MCIEEEKGVREREGLRGWMGRLIEPVILFQMDPELSEEVEERVRR